MMMCEMKKMKNENKDIRELMEKARTSIAATESLFKGGFYDFSASRAYYTMFYATQAVLLTKNLSFSKHSAVISEFGRHFIKEQILPLKLHRYIANAFDLRQAGDYGSMSAVSKEEAERLIKQTKEFIKIVEDYLKDKEYIK